MLLILGGAPLGSLGGTTSTPDAGVSLAGYATASTAAGPVNAATAIRITDPTP